MTNRPFKRQLKRQFSRSFNYFLALCCLLAGGALLAACSNNATPSAKPKATSAVGVSIRDLTYKTTAGKPFTVGLYGDKPLVMNIWATWCAPCIKELPSLLALQKKGEISVLAVSIDGDSRVIRNFLMANKLSELSVVWDPNGTITRPLLGLPGLPTSFIVNKQHQVVGSELGEREWDSAAMHDKIMAYLK